LTFTKNFSLNTNGGQFALLEYADIDLALGNFVTLTSPGALAAQIRNIGGQGVEGSGNVLERSENVK
jgi:hypothetical protein